MSALPLSAAHLVAGEAVEACAAAEDAAAEGLRWVQGDAGAAERARLRDLLERHFDAVWCSLRRLGVAETELDDCAQQVFVVASRKLRAVAEGRERAFLLGIAVNVASHARRSQRRRREVPEPEGEGTGRIDPGLLPDEALEQKELLALLDEALAAMPDDLRTVLVLFELEELSAPQIAAILGIPVGTVASRLRRAREELDRWTARRAEARPVRGGAR
jgi:RNA polymerase sigma-70 factor (ECF subfamily)